VPLAVEHNEADYEAWTSSIDHVRATPGFEGRTWPRPMTLDENLRDIEGHMEDFRLRRGFTYTVLTSDGDVIGCVYIYPGVVRSWVRESHAHLDKPLFDVVSSWLATTWPVAQFEYASR
jgi:hypothetical protein